MGSLPQPALQSIAERRSGSGEESEEDEEDEEGGWRAEATGQARGPHDETVLKTGYLSKKGERRKVSWLSFDSLDMICSSLIPYYVALDLEEKVVCLETCPSSLLQDGCRVQAPPPVGPFGNPFMLACTAEEACKYIRYGLTYENLLSSSRLAAGGLRMGEGNHRCSD